MSEKGCVKSPIDLLTLICSFVLLILFYREDMMKYGVVNDIRYGTEANATLLLLLELATL